MEGSILSIIFTIIHGFGIKRDLKEKHADLKI
jgi:hypothetical protein